MTAVDEAAIEGWLARTFRTTAYFALFAVLLAYFDPYKPVLVLVGVALGILSIATTARVARSITQPRSVPRKVPWLCRIAQFIKYVVLAAAIYLVSRWSVTGPLYLIGGYILPLVVMTIQTLGMGVRRVELRD